MIRNVTKKTILVEKTEMANSMWKKAKGLMFRASLPSDSGLLMTFGWDGKHEIWMLGMRFPIDLVFIGSDKRVVDVHRNFRPMGFDPRTWNVYRPKEKARYVLEANAGAAAKAKVDVGDVLYFKT